MIAAVMRTLSLLLVFLLGTLVARAQSILLPSPLILGNSSSRGPFLIDQTQASSVRCQEVFAASDFAVFNIDENLANIRLMARADAYRKAEAVCHFGLVLLNSVYR